MYVGLHGEYAWELVDGELRISSVDARVGELLSLPAPTAFKGDGEFEFLDLRPDANALHVSRLALHEMVGATWYRIRY